ncbi:hypothetical protein FOCG_17173 [Fusarium oxysporum f. sp. radicis-lycopersici 26381]|nr:hypothetical protein FOCG_17173 [Fusarium oxysporum f. sp. radicis-lycopersici 26381]
MSGMMPEWHPEEHIQAAQSFCMSHGAGIMPECSKVMIYMMSNGMTMHSAAEWDIFTSLLRTEMVGLTVNLQKLRNESPTIRAFSDNLFRNEIRLATESHEIRLATEPYDFRLMIEPYHRRARDTKNPLDRPLDLIQWLLESGQDPNTCLEARNENGPVTPIGHAIRAGHENLVHLLLQFDACINENQANRDGQTVIDLALEYPGSTATQLRIVKVLSGHYHPPDPHELLCAAIELRDIEFTKDLLHCDIDITKTRNPLRNHRSRMGIESYYIEIRSPLAMAMIKGGDFADLLLTQFLLKDRSDIYIASDVFIAAACGGDLSIMLRLYDLQPFGTTCDCKGVTPLQAAVASGSLAICEFLLERHGGASTALLLAAAMQNHANVLPLLIRYGACPRDLVQQDDISWLKLFVEIGSGVDETPRSILRMMFDLGLWDEWPIDCLSILIRSGALVDGDVARLAERWWDKSVADALDAGGNPNDRDLDGRTALQCALEEDHPPGQGRSERLLTVEILLKAGAKLNGGEVVKAIQSKDVELLIVLLRHGGSLTDVDEMGVCCLEAEITARNDESLQQLLEAQEGQIHAGPFCAAIQDQDWALVERLFARRHMQEGPHLLEGAAIGLAARFGRLDVLGKLLSRFTHPSVLYKALIPSWLAECSEITEGYTKLRGYWTSSSCIKRPLTGSPLVLAALSEDTSGFRELLRRGCCPDRLTFATIARMSKVSEYVEILRESDVRLCGARYNDEPVKAPLCVAIASWNDPMARYLIDSGADVNEHEVRMYKGTSPLQKAVEKNILNMVNYLLKNGASINAPPAFRSGATALQFAAIGGQIGVARHLIELGARVNARGARLNGSSALEGAAKHGRLDMVALLIHHGALTVGPGRQQLIRAVKLAQTRGHDAAVGLLKQECGWTVEDQDDLEDDFLDKFPGCEDCGRSYCCDEYHDEDSQCIHDYTEEEERYYADEGVNCMFT